MKRRSTTEQAEREARSSAILTCTHCDPCGWLLGEDRAPIDPAVRCTHGPRPPAGRDITEPIHPPDSFDTQEPQP